MAQSKTKKKMFNMAYGLGAAVVILGALFKIAHYPGGTEMLTIGMIVEAAVFALSAFEPVEEDLDWTNVYPELAGGEAKDKEDAKDSQGLLSQKLDAMLQEANLDSEMMSRLSTSISSFAGAAEGLKPATDSIAASNRYAEQLSVAAIDLPAQMATAHLAGFPVIYGLYVFVVSSLGFFIFGNNRYLSCGADSTIAPIFAVSLASYATF